MKIKISNDELRKELPRLVSEERKIIAVVLEHVAEVDRRRAYVHWGFSSMYDYMTRELKYSEGAANRRIKSARALQTIPEILEKVQDGSLKLSQISQVQSAIYRHEVNSGVKVQTSERREIFSSIVSKNIIETQKFLDSKFPALADSTPVKKTFKKDDSVEVTMRIPAELYKNLEEVKNLYSHMAPGADLLKLLELMAADVKKLRDPARARASSRARTYVSTSANSVHSSSMKESVEMTSRFAAAAVTKPVRRLVFQRDENRCQHFHQGTQCGSQFQLEIDHIQPKFAGGNNSPENLRLLCRVHNQQRYRDGSHIER